MRMPSASNSNCGSVESCLRRHLDQPQHQRRVGPLAVLHELRDSPDHAILVDHHRRMSELTRVRQQGVVGQRHLMRDRESLMRHRAAVTDQGDRIARLPGDAAEREISGQKRDRVHYVVATLGERGQQLVARPVLGVFTEEQHIERHRLHARALERVDQDRVVFARERPYAAVGAQRLVVDFDQRDSVRGRDRPAQEIAPVVQAQIDRVERAHQPQDGHQDPAGGTDRGAQLRRDSLDRGRGAHEIRVSLSASSRAIANCPSRRRHAVRRSARPRAACRRRPGRWSS